MTIETNDIVAAEEAVRESFTSNSNEGAILWVQTAQAHALISIAKSLKVLTDKVFITDPDASFHKENIRKEGQ